MCVYTYTYIYIYIYVKYVNGGAHVDSDAMVFVRLALLDVAKQGAGLTPKRYKIVVLISLRKKREWAAVLTEEHSHENDAYRGLGGARELGGPSQPARLGRRAGFASLRSLS